MKRLLKHSLPLATLSVALMLTVQVGEVKAADGPEWNAWILSTGWCNPCYPTLIGNAIACPCRINDPIIIHM